MYHQSSCIGGLSLFGPVLTKSAQSDGFTWGTFSLKYLASSLINRSAGTSLTLTKADREYGVVRVNKHLLGVAT